MTAPKSERYGTADLKEKIDQQIYKLATATDAAMVSEEMCRYLSMCARFHQYSIHNIWLILMEKPYATQVAGYQKWLSMGRYVRKGEKGIPILAPVTVKTVDSVKGDDIKLVGFKICYVFDFGQTEGQPLPEIPDWKSTEKNKALNDKLIKYTSSKGIKVLVCDLPGQIQGVSKGGAIELSPKGGTKTLIHEIVHELIHHPLPKGYDEKLIELEAEAIAYVVSSFFGIGGLNAPNYIALQGASSKQILTHMDHIRLTASMLIEQVEHTNR